MNEEIKKDINNNLHFSSVCDSTDEFNTARRQVEQGDLIFEYRNNKESETGNTLYSVTVRINNNYTTTDDSMAKFLDIFIVEIISEEYSVIYPHIPRTYLDVELYELLKDFNVPDDILITYKQIIEDLKQ